MLEHFSRCKALFSSRTTSVSSSSAPPLRAPPSPSRAPPLSLSLPGASFIVAKEQRLPAKDDGRRAALRHRLRIKILLTAESEFHFKVEFNYIRACLPASSRFLISPLGRLSVYSLSLSHTLFFFSSPFHSSTSAVRFLIFSDHLSLFVTTLPHLYRSSPTHRGRSSLLNENI